jgi:adenylate kinase
VSNFVYIGGVKGVGKTRLSTSILNKTAYHIVDVAEIMMEYSQAEHRDSLDEKSIDDRIAAREHAFQKAVQENCLWDTVFDSHFSIPNPNGHEWGIAWSHVACFKALVLVTAKAELILERRRKDTHRRRDALSLGAIKLDIEVERLYAEFVSETCNIPLFIVDNDDFDQAQISLFNILSRIEQIQ